MSSVEASRVCACVRACAESDLEEHQMCRRLVRFLTAVENVDRVLVHICSVSLLRDASSGAFGTRATAPAGYVPRYSSSRRGVTDPHSGQCAVVLYLCRDRERVVHGRIFVGLKQIPYTSHGASSRFLCFHHSVIFIRRTFQRFSVETTCYTR